MMGCVEGQSIFCARFLGAHQEFYPHVMSNMGSVSLAVFHAVNVLLRGKIDVILCNCINLQVGILNVRNVFAECLHVSLSVLAIISYGRGGGVMIYRANDVFSISISVVSHGQGDLVSALLKDIHKHCSGVSLEVLLTVNVPEIFQDSLRNFSFPVRVINNKKPLGFGENHNRAFRHAEGRFFCIINPDIRIDSNIFPVLMDGLGSDALGIVAPLVVDGAGAVENSARYFPTPFKILCKAMGRCIGNDYVIQSSTIYPDWVGGMFMVMSCDLFERINGFNQRYFMYYEDVDLCARVWLSGLKVALIPQIRATHLARRSSHGNMRYFVIHIRSMMRFFLSFTFLKIMCLRRLR